MLVGIFSLRDFLHPLDPSTASFVYIWDFFQAIGLVALLQRLIIFNVNIDFRSEFLKGVGYLAVFVLWCVRWLSSLVNFYLRRYVCFLREMLPKPNIFYLFFTFFDALERSACVGGRVWHVLHCPRASSPSTSKMSVPDWHRELFYFCCRNLSPSTDDALIRGSDWMYHCTDLWMSGMVVFKLNTLLQIFSRNTSTREQPYLKVPRVCPGHERAVRRICCVPFSLSFHRFDSHSCSAHDEL